MEQKVRKSSTKGRKIQQNNPLGKGRACATCRARKVRCSGEHPACRACLRTARFEGRDLSQVVCQYDGRAGGGGKKGRKSAVAVEGGEEYGLAVLEEDGSEGAAYALGGMMAGSSSYTLPPLDPYAYPSFPEHPPQLAPSPYLPPGPNPVNSSFTPTPPLSYASSHSPEDSVYQQSPPQTATSAPPSVAYDQQPSTSGNGWTTFSSRPPVPLSGSTSSPHLLANGSGMYPSRRAGISSSGGEHADAGAPFSSTSSSAYFDATPRHAYNPPAPSTSPYSAYAPRRPPAVAYDQPAPSPSYPTYSTSSSYYPSPSTAPPHHPGNIPAPPPPSSGTTPVPYLSANETASSSSYPQSQGYYRPLPSSSSSAAPRTLLHNDPTFSVPLSARDPAPPLHHHHHPHQQRGQGLRLAPLPSPTLGMSAYALSSSSTTTTPYPRQQQQQVKPAASTPGFLDVDSWLRGLAHP